MEIISAASMGLFSKHKELHATELQKTNQKSFTDQTLKPIGFLALKLEPIETDGTCKENSKNLKEHLKGDTEADSLLEENDDIEGVKKVYSKEKAPLNDGFEIQLGDSEAETETYINTKLNALLYHTSDDSIDRYKSENTQSDLLDRLYYDDYDPSNRLAVASLSSLVPVSLPLRSGITSPRQKQDLVALRSENHSPLVDLSTLASESGPMFEVGDAAAQASGVSLDRILGDSLLGGNKKPVRPLFALQVSFDTLSDFHHQAITLKAKHPEFKFRRNNKCFLIGFNNDSESFKAVEWAFLEMVVHGDTIIVLHVLDSKTVKKLDRAIAEATFEKIKSLNTHRRKISIVFESVIGQPQRLLKQAISEYKPAMMIVGTSHYGQALAPTSHGNSSTNLHQQASRLHVPFFSKVSISKYFLQFALVPVILVKPFYEIHELLDRPINGEKYFLQWLAGIDVSHTYEKKKKKFLAMRSPSGSRNSSHTSLVDLEAQSRGRSDLFTMSSRDSSVSRLQSRSARPEGRSSHREQNQYLSRADQDRTNEDERARSRSRSRLSRIFSN